MRTFFLCCAALLLAMGCTKKKNREDEPLTVKKDPLPAVKKAIPAPLVKGMSTKPPGVSTAPKKPALRAVESLPERHIELTPEVLALMKRVNDLIVPGTPRLLHVELMHDLYPPDLARLPKGELRFRYGMPQFDEKNRIFAVAFELATGAVGRGKWVHVLFPDRDPATKKLRLRYDVLPMKRWEETFDAYSRRTLAQRMAARGEKLPPELMKALKKPSSPETTVKAPKGGTLFPIPAVPRDERALFEKDYLPPSPASMKRMAALKTQVKPAKNVVLTTLFKTTLGPESHIFLPKTAGEIVTVTPLVDSAGRTVALSLVFIPEALQKDPAKSKEIPVLITIYPEKGEKGGIALGSDVVKLDRFTGDIVVTQHDAKRLGIIALTLSGTAWLDKSGKATRRKVKAQMELFWYRGEMQETLTRKVLASERKGTCDIVDKGRTLWRRTNANDLVLIHQTLTSTVCLKEGKKTHECSRSATFYLLPKDRQLRFFADMKKNALLARTNPHLAEDLKELDHDSSSKCADIAF